MKKCALFSMVFVLLVSLGWSADARDTPAAGAGSKPAQFTCPKKGESHCRAVLRLFDAMNARETYDMAIAKALDAQLMAQPDIAPFRGVMERFFAEYASWDAILPDVVMSYMEEFTEVEVDEITAFYKTPTGKKAVERLPALFERGSQIGMKAVQNNQSHLIRMIEEEVARQEGSNP